MSEKYKPVEGGLYFVTITVVGWIDLFIRRNYQELLIENTRLCQEHKGLALYCYYIMPSHIHWIASRKQGRLSDLLRDFKSYTAKELLALISRNQRESRNDWMLKQFGQYGFGSPQKQQNQL